MTQYLMDKEKDFEHLQYALDNYNALRLRISPFSLGHETKLIFKDLGGKTLTFQKDKGLKFLLDGKELINFPLKHYTSGFKLEYQEKN